MLRCTSTQLCERVDGLAHNVNGRFAQYFVIVGNSIQSVSTAVYLKMQIEIRESSRSYRWSERISRINRLRRSSISSPVAPPGATMAISFQSDEEVLRKLRDKLHKMTDEELIRFGKEVRRLADNPFQRQLEEASLDYSRFC
jgi:hypothetical protein